jgi:phosphatidylserine decarboxylase
MARLGYSRIAAAVILTAAAWWLLPGMWRWIVGGLLLLLLGLLVQFYRDPHREPRGPVAAASVLSPADGRVVDVHRDPDHLFISIFLSPFDVHVNRAPVTGRVVELHSIPGRFLAAFSERASAENERVRLLIDSPEAGRVVCTQVAGLLARRIENWIQVGQEVTRGERYGMIHLGSRIDLELPGRFTALTAPGQRVRAGVSVLAEPVAG